MQHSHEESPELNSHTPPWATKLSSKPHPHGLKGEVAVNSQETRSLKLKIGQLHLLFKVREMEVLLRSKSSTSEDEKGSEGQGLGLVSCG